jgi:hypothetical protein
MAAFASAIAAIASAGATFSAMRIARRTATSPADVAAADRAAEATDALRED